MSKATASITSNPEHRDPLVEEIRAIKQRVSATVGHDVRVLCNQLEQEQASRKGHLVDRRAARKSSTSAGVR